ncbi:hypothetical protein [Brevibacillus sp. SIMBA_076]|uniref:hypothetical protein n=1 Tax=Brevibacillus sp. SIMBA_076 TaxID=3085814 RepID=UPI00397AF571
MKQRRGIWATDAFSVFLKKHLERNKWRLQLTEYSFTMKLNGDSVCKTGISLAQLEAIHPGCDFLESIMNEYSFNERHELCFTGISMEE